LVFKNVSLASSCLAPSALASTSPTLECFCVSAPQQGSIQNLMEQIGGHIRSVTTGLVLRSCDQGHFSVNVNLGQERGSDNLEVHNRIVKYSLKSFSSATVHLEGEVYKNTTIEFLDVSGELTLKANLDFQQFPENFLYAATPSTQTILTLLFRDVNKVTMSYLLVKNFDSKSLIAIDAKQTQQFTVKKIKFNQTDNLIFANRCLSGEEEVSCEEVLAVTEGEDPSMLVMMGLILAITAAAILVIFYKDGFKGSQGRGAQIDMALHRSI